MKKISILSCVLLAALSSCKMFEIDNYDGPEETIQGKVIDAETKEPVLTDQSGGGIAVRMLELSWGDNRAYNDDFWCRPDGTFRNTKIFKGNYRVHVEGPFIPLIREKNSTPVFDGSQEIYVEGTKDVVFEVQPFLRVKIVGEPQVRAGVITAQVVVERAVSEEDFRTKISEMDAAYDAGWFNVTDIQLFVSMSSTVGNSTRDERWSNRIEYASNSFNALLGQPVTISSLGSIPAGYTVFVRAAARINYSTYNERRWNYSEKVDVMIPSASK